jgi:hypothetical protein
MQSATDPVFCQLSANATVALLIFHATFDAKAGEMLSVKITSSDLFWVFSESTLRKFGKQQSAADPMPKGLQTLRQRCHY